MCIEIMEAKILKAYFTFILISVCVDFEYYQGYSWRLEMKFDSAGRALLEAKTERFKIIVAETDK